MNVAISAEGARPGFLDRPAAAVWIAAAGAAIVFSVPIARYVAQDSDFRIHIQYAKDIHQLSDIVSPHFLFQVLLIGINRLTGISYEAAAIALMSLCYASMAALVALRMRVADPLLDPWRIAAVAVLVLMASHIFLQTAFKLNFYYGYIAPITYHNPTQVLLKALAVGVLFVYFALEERQGAVWRILLPIGIVLSAIAKPTFMIAFLPCVCAVEFFRAVAGRPWRPAAGNVALVAVPACIVLALQYGMAYGEGGGGLGFAPFLVYGGPSEVLPKLPASLLFPVVAAVMVWRQRAVSRQLAFAWFLYAVGMAISLCAVESGPRLGDGNFAWTGQTVTFLLYVESAVALMAMPWRRAWPAWAAFALHVFFGMVWYLAPLLLPLGTFW
jgi:hypothetical protein